MALPENVTTQLRSLLFSRDQELISLVGEVLKTLDIDVSRCSAAQEAMQKLRARNSTPLLLTMRMPGCGDCFVGGEISGVL